MIIAIIFTVFHSVFCCNIHSRKEKKSFISCCNRLFLIFIFGNLWSFWPRTLLQRHSILHLQVRLGISIVSFKSLSCYFSISSKSSFLPSEQRNFILTLDIHGFLIYGNFWIMINFLRMYLFRRNFLSGCFQHLWNFFFCKYFGVFYWILLHCIYWSWLLSYIY